MLKTRKHNEEKKKKNLDRSFMEFSFYRIFLVFRYFIWTFKCAKNKIK